MLSKVKTIANSERTAPTINVRCIGPKMKARGLETSPSCRTWTPPSRETTTFVGRTGSRPAATHDHGDGGR